MRGALKQLQHQWLWSTPLTGLSIPKSLPRFLGHGRFLIFVAFGLNRFWRDRRRAIRPDPVLAVRRPDGGCSMVAPEANAVFQGILPILPKNSVENHGAEEDGSR